MNLPKRTIQRIYREVDTGKTYRVVGVANIVIHSEGRPITVIYTGADASLWSIPLTDFNARFINIEEQT